MSPDVLETPSWVQAWVLAWPILDGLSSMAYDDHEIEAFEKMTLSISILISQTVFLSLLAKRIPETSLDIPLLGGYLLFTMSMVSVRVVLVRMKNRFMQNTLARVSSIYPN